MSGSRGAADVVEEVRRSPAQKVKVAITDVDGILRGKYVHKEKFLSAAESGFGFCNVVFGWDSSDVCYDNAAYTGWHSGYPDALARIDGDAVVTFGGAVPVRRRDEERQLLTRLASLRLLQSL